jgi:hypothetical protein
MDTLKPSALTTELLSTGQSGVPLVICSEAPRVRKRIESAGYQEVKINKELSKRLLDIPKEIVQNVWKSTKSMLNYHVPIFVTDFEMLFDPRYEIEYYVLLRKGANNKCGYKMARQFTDGKLTYATPKIQIIMSLIAMRIRYGLFNRRKNYEV